MFKKFYEEEINNSNTRYFIFDTHGNSEWDNDFIKYSWETNRYNQVKEGDLFIYRRPKRSSENGQFYFFGAGKVGKIEKNNLSETGITAHIDKAYIFNDYIYANDLDDFQWHFRQRNSNWSHFFNQYGMNLITKEDFINLLDLSESNIQTDENLVETYLDFQNQIKNKDYSAEDTLKPSKAREKHHVFANEIKKYYSNKCAICGLSTKEFLIASHIIPWRTDKANRLNPSNGICLCVFHDKAFDKGFISIDDNYKVIISNTKIPDKELLDKLENIRNKKITLPHQFKPDKNFLSFHRKNILKS